jgi:hypothetical protein
MRSRYLGRIAIWNRAKIIIAIAMGILLIDISLFIDGKYLLQITGEYLVYLVIS